MKSELILALDVPSTKEIPEIVDSLPEELLYYKVGLELFTAEGPSALSYIKKKGKKVFLDLKLHDIPRTVANAVSTAGKHGIDIMTVHAGGGRDMLKAAAEAARELGDSAPKLVAVTALTSLDQDDLAELGVTRPIKEHALALGELAIECGIDGLVCSPLEIEAFRERIGTDPIIITPGIRPAHRQGSGQAVSDAGDQKRIATPEMAVKAGSSFLVVGRPIMQADDPAAAAREILEQMNV